MRDYYCNQKFNWLKIDAEKKTTYSCCEAAPDSIDSLWLEKNPGMIFNTIKLQQERQNMLDNKRIKSCENACWISEDNKLSSRRLEMKGNERTNSQIISQPTTLDITISGECNLTCSYCCKEFSSAWRNDIFKNGNYSQLTDIDKNRYKISNHDLALRKSSQKNRIKLKQFELIEKEIELMSPHLKQVLITGGEPFLNYNLINILKKLKNIPQIIIFTGLGINKIKLKNILEKICNYKNITLSISAESTQENYEFNRFGNTWQNFLECIEIIKDTKIAYKFSTTYSNLTVLDYVKFNTLYTHDKSINLVHEPEFMSVWVLDDITKKELISQIHTSTLSNTHNSKIIIDLLSKDPSEIDRKNLEYFVKEFCKRRNIKPNFMPASLKKWLNLL
jgi:molybdenum cofactor biosynthesis enzyme MoaA